MHISAFWVTSICVKGCHLNSAREAVHHKYRALLSDARAACWGVCKQAVAPSWAGDVNSGERPNNRLTSSSRRSSFWKTWSQCYLWEYDDGTGMNTLGVLIKSADSRFLSLCKTIYQWARFNCALKTCHEASQVVIHKRFTLHTTYKVLRYTRAFNTTLCLPRTCYFHCMGGIAWQCQCLQHGELLQGAAGCSLAVVFFMFSFYIFN